MSICINLVNLATDTDMLIGHNPYPQFAECALIRQSGLNLARVDQPRSFQRLNEGLD
jgi:hypothetical protein